MSIQPPEEIYKKIDDWKKIWEEMNSNDVVLSTLIDITKVNLPRDLELYVYGTGLGAMSNPLIMGIVGRGGKMLDENYFRETVIHEIIHRFVGDPENNIEITDYWNKIREEYETESRLTQNHIVVYAVLKIALLKLFGEWSS